VLSGFIIMEACNEFYRDRPFAFALNRFLRIFPPFAAALVVCAIIYYMLMQQNSLRLYDTAETFSPDDFAPMVLLRNLLSIIPGLKAPADVRLFIDIVWAVRVELQFYGIVALAMLGAVLVTRHMRTRRKNLFEILLVLAALLHLPAYALWALGRAPATFSFAPYFIFGGAMYYALRGARTGVILAACMLPLILHQFVTYEIPTLAEFQVDKTHEPLITGFYVFLQLALMLAFLAATAALSRGGLPYGAEVDRFFGDLSYPLYLNHVLAGNIAASLYSVSLAWLFPLACLTGIALSWGMFLLVEPQLRAVRTLIRGKRL
jgi:peptidoglycan/LPS O-acetylase OafA/YrhL